MNSRRTTPGITSRLGAGRPKHSPHSPLSPVARSRRPSGQYDLDEVRREAFAHLRSVAAGRGGAAGDRLTAERVALTAAKRRREERQDQLEAGQLARLAVVRRYLEQMALGHA